MQGFTGGGTLNVASMWAQLKPLRDRKASADQVINRLRGKLSRIPGATLYMQAAQDIRIGGRGGNLQYQFTLQSDKLADLSEWAPKLLAKLKTLPIVLDANSDQQIHGLESRLIIDRSTASRLGVNPQAIDTTLYSAFGQRPGLDHVHRDQSVSRGDGSASRVPGKSGVAQFDLCANQYRSARTDLYVHSSPHGFSLRSR